MKLNSTIEDTAILSNTVSSSEFKIKNSAKAFQILSSGLYSNKIRAIIRELSCNAYDSHVAAGKADVPFEVHLPSMLEPWFSVRDFGIGLSHDQVVNIFTTYFESTKTDSNDFIGGLGLGSKSPFSYIDNFSVTAIKDGKKGIYTAYIADNGTPSISLMVTTETTEPNGVEIKFSVTNSYDFHKFASEAADVYAYFKTAPTVLSDGHFKIDEIKYDERDIAPGVHLKNRRQSNAIMGNVAYPINVPNVDSRFKEDEIALLRAGVDIHFNIGDLDIQASREGLSYIPSTIDAIQKRLREACAALTDYLAKKIDAIDGKWAKAAELIKINNRRDLFQYATVNYLKKHPSIPAIADSSYGNHIRWKSHTFSEQDLTDLNINITKISEYHGSYRNKSYGKEYDFSNRIYDRKTNSYINTTSITVTYGRSSFLICNEGGPVIASRVIKSAFVDHANYLFPDADAYQSGHHRELELYILRPADPSKPMETDKFFKKLEDPVDIFDIEHLPFTPPAKTVTAKKKKKTSIYRIADKISSRYDNDEVMFSNAGMLEDINDKKNKFYYVPLQGLSIDTSATKISSMRALNLLRKVFDINIFGVCKGDIKEVKELKNWVQLDDVLSERFKNMFTSDFVLLMAHYKLFNANKHNNSQTGHSSQMFFQLFIKDRVTRAAPLTNTEYTNFNNLLDSGWFAKESQVIRVKKYIDLAVKSMTSVSKKYPLLPHISSNASEQDIKDYIKMIDESRQKNVVDKQHAGA